MYTPRALLYATLYITMPLSFILLLEFGTYSRADPAVLVVISLGIALAYVGYIEGRRTSKSDDEEEYALFKYVIDFTRSFYTLAGMVSALFWLIDPDNGNNEPRTFLIFSIVGYIAFLENRFIRDE